MNVSLMLANAFIFKALERIMTKTANMGLFTGAKMNHSSGLLL